MSNSRRSVSIDVSSRSFASAASSSALRARFARHIERLLFLGPFSTECIEFGRQGTHLVALLAALLGQLGVVALDDMSVLLDECGEAIDDVDLSLDHQTLALRSGTCFLVGLETALGLGQPALVELLTFVQPCESDFDVAPARCQQGRPCFELGSELTTRSGSGRFGLLVALERREQRLDLGDPLTLAFDVGSSLGHVPVERLEFRVDLALLALGTRQAFGCRAEPGIVCIEPSGQFGLGVLGGAEHLLGLCHRVSCRLELGARSVRTLGCLFERCRGRSATGCPDPPTAESEPIAVTRDDDGLGMLHRHIEGVGELIDPNRRAEQRVEQGIDLGAFAASMRPYCIADRRGRRTSGASAQGDDRSAGVTAAQRVERTATGRRVVDDDGCQGLAERCFDDRLPACIDLDQVEERAEHSVDALQTLGTRASACCIECHLQCLDAGSPSRGLLGGIIAERLASFERGLRLDRCVLGRFDLVDERRLDRAGLVAVGPESSCLLLRELEAVRQRFLPAGHPLQFAFGPCDRRRDRPQLTAHLRRCTRCLRGGLVLPDGFEDVLALAAERRLVEAQLPGLGFEFGELGGRLVDLVTESGSVGFEVRDHAGVEQLPLVAFERTTALDQHGGKPAGALTELFDVAQAVADVAGSACGELRLDRHHRGVEHRERGLEFLLARRALQLGRRQRFELDPEAGDLAA